MHVLIKAAFIATTVLVSATAFAQSTERPTREQIRAELSALENAGYNPLSSCSGDCPGSLRRAEVTLTQRQNSASAAYGAGFNGTQQSGK